MVDRASLCSKVKGHDSHKKKRFGLPGRTFFEEALLLAAVAVLVCVVYSNTFHSPFTFDDVEHIENNRRIRLSELTLEGIGEAVCQRRPVAKLSFALNYYFHQYDVFGYHVVNILIHVTTGILLYLLVRTTLGIPWVGSMYPCSRWIPFFGAFIWLVHPLQTQSVTYVVQRMSSMAGMFYVASLFLYARARLSDERRKKIMLLAGSAHCGVLALGSKQMTAILPFFVFLYEWYFFQRLNKDWLKRNLKYVGGVVALFCLFTLIFLGVNPLERLQSIGDYSRNEFTFGERVWTQPRVLLYYLSLLSFPHPSRLNLDYDFALSHSLIDPVTTFFSLGALIGILGLAFGLAKKEPLVSFGILWFFGNLVIESSVIPVAIIFEHRTYLPSMLVVVTVVMLAFRHIRVGWMTMVLLCSVAGLFSFWTYERNMVWGDEVTLWRDCVRKSPQKARPHNNLGYALREEGRLDEAIRHYHEALRIKPDYGEAHVNLGAALALQGKVHEAMGHYAEALRIDPGSVGAHSNMASALVKLGRFDEAANHAYAALRIDPFFAEAYSHLGSALAGLGRLEEAVGHSYQAAALKPDHAEAHVNLGALLLRQGHIEEAVAHLSTALKIDPRSAEAHYNLGLGLARQERFEEAMGHFFEALQLRPGSAEVHYSLGLALALQGSRQEAMEHFAKAVELKPDHGQAHGKLGAMLAKEGRPEEAIRHFSEVVRIKPDAANGYYNLGLLFARERRSQEAMEHLRKALELKPDYGEAHLNLGAMLAREGRLEEAVHHFSEAVRIKPELSEAKEYLEKAQKDLRSRRAREP
jgi:tetratricopeptide (TPR) repeat protein